MKKVIEIDPLQDPRWDSFVENHDFGWLCHLSGWKNVLERSFSHMKSHYIVIEDNGIIEAGLPVYEVKSRFLGNRLISIPFATLSDPLVSSQEDMEILTKETMKIMKSQKASFIEVRAHQSNSLIQNGTLDVHPYHKHHFLNLDESPELLIKKFDRSCVRQKINKACKGNLLLKECSSKEDLKTFHRLHMMTRRERQGLPPKPFIFFESLWDEFSTTQNLSVLLCEHDGQTIAGVLLLKHNKRVSIEISAYDKNYIKLNPVHFLFWHSINKAYNDGYGILDFGSTPPSNTGLMDFKKRWATEVTDLVNCCHYKKERKEHDRTESFAYKIIQGVSRRLPDNMLEGFGTFFYRHLG